MDFKFQLAIHFFLPLETRGHVPEASDSVLGSSNLGHLHLVCSGLGIGLELELESHVVHKHAQFVHISISTSLEVAAIATTELSCKAVPEANPSVPTGPVLYCTVHRVH